MLISNAFSPFTFKSDLRKHIFEFTLISLGHLVGHAMAQLFVLVLSFYRIEHYKYLKVYTTLIINFRFAVA